MWCLISQSNSMVFEVRVDPKSIGQECLEKVRIFCKFYLKLAGDILKPENANLFFFGNKKYGKKRPRKRFTVFTFFHCLYSFENTNSSQNAQDLFIGFSNSSNIKKLCIEYQSIFQIVTTYVKYYL